MQMARIVKAHEDEASGLAGMVGISESALEEATGMDVCEPRFP